MLDVREVEKVLNRKYSREREMTKCQGEFYRRGLAGKYLREALSSTDPSSAALRLAQ
jgi:hypothetical protein